MKRNSFVVMAFVSFAFVIVDRSSAVDARARARLVALEPCARASELVVFWHGMGDFGDDPRGMKVLANEIANVTHEETCVKTLVFGTSAEEDRRAGYVASVNAQVEDACEVIARDFDVRRMNGTYHAYGFSQGGQFMRAVVERCRGARAKTLTTFGAQHMGVDSIPGCGHDATSTMCRWMNRAASAASANAWVQNHVVQAQYFRDTSTAASYERYLASNVFLPEINNEGQANENTNYRDAIASLEKFVCVMFENDDMVSPKESSWFGSRMIGNRTIVPYERNEEIYASLGLDALDADGRLEFVLVPNARHLEFSLDWFREFVKKNLA